MPSIEVDDNYMAQAFAPAELAYKSQVLGDTWGHLAPEPRRRYPGYVLFTHGAWGDLVPIRAEFQGLEDSPWFFDDLEDFIGRTRTEEGRVYRFQGTYMKYKNGGYRFSGQVREQKLAGW